MLATIGDEKFAKIINMFQEHLANTSEESEKAVADKLSLLISQKERYGVPNIQDLISIVFKGIDAQLFAN